MTEIEIEKILNKYGYITTREENLYFAGVHAVIWDSPYRTPDTDRLAFSYLAKVIMLRTGEDFGGELGTQIVYDEQVRKYRFHNE